MGAYKPVTYKGKTYKALSILCSEKELSYTLVYGRIRRGMSVEEAIDMGRPREYKNRQFTEDTSVYPQKGEYPNISKEYADHLRKLNKESIERLYVLENTDYMKYCAIVKSQHAMINRNTDKVAEILSNQYFFQTFDYFLFMDREDPGQVNYFLKSFGKDLYIFYLLEAKKPSGIYKDILNYLNSKRMSEGKSAIDLNIKVLTEDDFNIEKVKRYCEERNVVYDHIETVVSCEKGKITYSAVIHAKEKKRNIYIPLTNNTYLGMLK